MPHPDVPAEWVRNPSDTLAIAQGCRFDEEAGEFACDFVEAFCRQSKGKSGGKPITLLDWQRDFLMRLFGWKRADGLRRFRRSYLEVAKKNGKSTLLSAVALYLLIADGEPGPEVYLNACNRDQARIIFDEAAKMVDASPDLKSRLSVIDSRHRIVSPANNGLLRCNSADAPSKDGLNPHGIIFDELHRQPDTSLWDIFEHADSAREQPLWINITTAGEDETGVWFEMREYSEKVNKGDIPDVTHLGVIYRALESDDIDDPATWLKANPSLGATLTEDNLRLKLDQAKETPRKLAEFKRLRLNIISKSDLSFLSPEDWKACDSPRIDPDELKGLPCYLGGDLSKVIDLTALVGLWGDEASGYDLLAWFFMPEDNVKELSLRDRQPYQHWIDQGWIVATPGNVVDYGYLRKVINDIAAGHRLVKFLCDPHNATKTLIELEQEDGLPVEEIRQGFISLNAPTKQLLRLVKSGKIRNGGNPVMKWMVGNAIAEEDAAGCVKLSKKKSRLKIDGMAALVNAVAAAGTAEDAESTYNTSKMMLL